MPEHSPAPTSHRGVYGFAVYLIFKTLFVLYILWAFLPTWFLEDILGLTYLPDKYFALYIPFLLLFTITISFVIYPAYNLTLTPSEDDTWTIYDDTNSPTALSEQQRKLENGILNPKIFTSNGKSKRKSSIDKDEEQLNIAEFCDCPDGARCLLREKPNHITMLKNRKRIPIAIDLSSDDITKILLRNYQKNQNE